MSLVIPIATDKEAVVNEERFQRNIWSKAWRSLFREYYNVKARQWYLPRRPWNLNDLMGRQANTTMLRTIAEIIRKKSNVRQKQVEEQHNYANIHSHFQRLSR